MLDYVPLRYRSLRLGRVLDKLYLSQYCSDKADLPPPNLLTKAPASLPGNGGAILPSPCRLCITHIFLNTRAIANQLVESRG